jgi:hypothetical protein
MAYHRVEDGPWPAGTTVVAYLTSSLVGGQPSGPQVSSGVASANGVVELGGLTEGVSYTAFGSSGTQQFVAMNQEARLEALEEAAQATAPPTGIAATDVATIHAARDAAAVGGTVRLSAGVYVVNGLDFNKSMTLDLSAGATLRLASGTNGPLATVSAARVTIKGGTIDGNLAGQSAYHYLLEATADDTTLDGVRFTNALACQVRLRWSTKGHKVLRCLFDGPGANSAVVTSSRNALEVHSSHTLVALNTFRNIYQGHGVRVGRYLLTDVETVEHNLVALNQFENILDPVNESPAMKAEVNTTHSGFIANTVKNVTRWLKMDSCSHITVALNQISGALSPSGVNAANCPFATFFANRLKDCGGGIQVGVDAIAIDNQLREHRRRPGSHDDRRHPPGHDGVARAGRRQRPQERPALPDPAVGLLLPGHRQPAGGLPGGGEHRADPVGGSGTVAGEIAHNTVISPSSISGTVIAFQGTGNKLRVVDNTLDGAADTGVSVFTTASPYVAGNIVGDATAPIAIGGGTTDPLIGLNPGAPSSDYQDGRDRRQLHADGAGVPAGDAAHRDADRGPHGVAGGRLQGREVPVVRSGGGAFTLNVAASSTKSLNTGDWVDVQHDGTAWQITGYGSLPTALGPRIATVVASNYATAVEKAGADITCDGVDDQVEINAAIDAIKAATPAVGVAGGKVLLVGPRFNTSNSVILKSYIALEGDGWFATEIKSQSTWNGAASSGLIALDNTGGTTATEYTTLRGLTVHGNKSGQTAVATRGLSYVVDATSGFTYNDSVHTVDYVRVVDTKDDGIRLSGPNVRANRFSNIRVERADLNGFRTDAADSHFHAWTSAAAASRASTSTARRTTAGRTARRISAAARTRRRRPRRRGSSRRAGASRGHATASWRAKPRTTVGTASRSPRITTRSRAASPTRTRGTRPPIRTASAAA